MGHGFSCQGSPEIEVAINPPQWCQMVFVFPFVVCHGHLDTSNEIDINSTIAYAILTSLASLAGPGSESSSLGLAAFSSGS